MNVKEDDQALAVLATEAGVLKLDEVATTILLVKPGDSIKEVMKNLTTASSEVLSRTYAFLMNLREDDDDVNKFVKDGLVQMIFYRLKQLMPIGCKKCNKVYKSERTEVARVSCRVCGVGACRECYPAEEARGKWFYLCGSCDKTVCSMMGEDALDAKHFRKKKGSKDKAVAATQGESESENRDEQDKNTEEEKEEVIEVEGDDFEEVRNNKRGFRANKKIRKTESNEKEKESEKKIPICSDFHNVKMCFNSMNQKKCSNAKDCPNGYQWW